MFRAPMLCALVLLSPTALYAQSHKGTVSGTGAVEISKLPDAMRVQIDLRAKGKTLAEALANLRGARETAVAKMLRLGAIKESIQQSETVVLLGKMPPLIGEEPPIAGLATVSPEGTVVAVVVKADWTISAQDSEAMLLFVEGLRERIEEADIGGLKSAPAAEADKGKPCNCGCKPGEPTFLFIAHISEQEKSSALAAAFQKAKLAAASLAKAAGTDLGELRQLGVTPAKAETAGPMGLAPAFDVDLASKEIPSFLASALTVRVSVSASFYLLDHQKRTNEDPKGKGGTE